MIKCDPFYIPKFVAVPPALESITSPYRTKVLRGLLDCVNGGEHPNCRMEILVLIADVAIMAVVPGMLDSISHQH